MSILKTITLYSVGRKSFVIVFLFLIPSFVLGQRLGGLEKDVGLARSYDEQAWKLERNFEHQKAYALYQKSMAIYEEYGLWGDYIKNLRGLMVIEAFRGNVEKGQGIIRVADSLIAVHKVIQSEPLFKVLEGKSFFYLVLEKPDSVIRFSNETLALYRTSGGLGKIEAARVYNGIAGAYDQQDRFDLAIQYFDSATYLVEEAEGLESSFASTIFYNKAATYKKAGNYEKALEYDFRSLEISRQFLDPYHIYIATSYLGIGQDYLGRNNGKEDVKLALEQFDKCNEILNVNPDINYLYHVYAAYGEAYNILGEFEKSEDYYLKAIQIVVNLFGEQYSELIQYYHALSEVYMGMGDRDKAEKYLEKALVLIESDEAMSFRSKANNRLLLAQCKIKFDPLSDNVGVLYQEALSILVSDFQPTNIFDNPTVDQLSSDNTILNILLDKAEFLEQSFEENNDAAYLDAALNSYLLATEYIKLARKGLITMRYKLTLNERNDELYEKAIQLALRLFELQPEETYLLKAIEMVENRKSSLLLDQLSEIEAKSFSNIPDSLLERDKRLKSDIDYAGKLIFEQSSLPPDQRDDALIAEYRARVFNLEHEREQLIKKLESGFPEYVQLKHNPENFDVAEVQSLIKENQAIVEFFWGKDSLYVFTIGKKDVSYHIVPNIVVLETEVNMFLSALKSGDIDGFVENAHAIYSKLLAGKSEQILQKTDYVCIIPDNILSYIPFETLISHVPEGRLNYRKLPYLIKNYTISYHYSASLLTKSINVEKSKDWDEPFIGFAPTFNQQKVARHRGSPTDSIIIGQLLNLPQAAAEVENISDFLGGTYHLGETASEETFKKMANNNQVIHLATHTIINDVNPLYSKLVFTPNADKTEDGMLHTYELYNMQLNAQMVSLSACNTGVGRYFKGEGIVSLARGFMYAGVPNVMMSFWSVPDQSTAKIMQSFYEEIEKDNSRAVALRNAKLSYLKNSDALTANPYYWGAFVLLGEIEDNSSSPLEKYWWLLLIPALGLAWIVALKARSR
ncbi:CHAT domain-containing tetratricopeptide repeat protein [Flammeovirgaceae bacterium SG7u.111]|nr:CHAT domain-containing tetratricopeptide repeat protein [Flammeovirgaceae bacterium SG7u.132]WPO35807.1 CHAT domain-containing tetratricopeptide repeat protein [Flammeovirgaceae bacterium SG7u.111]